MRQDNVERLKIKVSVKNNIQVTCSIRYGA